MSFTWRETIERPRGRDGERNAALMTRLHNRRKCRRRSRGRLLHHRRCAGRDDKRFSLIRRPTTTCLFAARNIYPTDVERMSKSIRCRPTPWSSVDDDIKGTKPSPSQFEDGHSRPSGDQEICLEHAPAYQQPRSWVTDELPRASTKKATATRSASWRSSVSPRQFLIVV